MGPVAYRPREASSGRVICWLHLCVLLLAGAMLWSGASSAQTFVSEGPGPRIGQIQNVQSGDAPPNGTGAGAVQAILPDPVLGANTYFVASPNGGVWVTNN